MSNPANVSVCVLCYGEHVELAKRCLESIMRDETEHHREILVGANSPGSDSRGYLQSLKDEGKIDVLILSDENLYKCPMMAKLLPRARHEFIWWFDDDSHIVEPRTLDRWIEIAQQAPAEVGQWGALGWCDHPLQFTHMNEPANHEFVRASPYYRGLPLPSWRPGGKGEFNYQGRNTGDGRWYFNPGGCWLAKQTTLKTLQWPDPRLKNNAEDIYLGEAMRQNGFQVANNSAPGIRISDFETRLSRDTSVKELLEDILSSKAPPS